MFDIGAMELFLVAVVALIVVGPRELPALLRTVTGFVRKIRELSSEFRSGVSDLASEIEKEVDPFKDLREQERLRPGMSPREITEHIMANKSNAPENTIHNDQNESETSQNADETEYFETASEADIEKMEKTASDSKKTQNDKKSVDDEKMKEGHDDGA